MHTERGGGCISGLFQSGYMDTNDPSYLKALLRPQTRPRSFWLKIISKSKRTAQSTHRDTLNTEETSEREREREKYQVLPPPERVSRLHAPVLLSRCPDNVSTLIGAHLFSV